MLVSNDVSRVAQVVVVAMLTNIVSGPALGVIVDRYNGKYLVMAAHLGIAAVMMSLGLVWLNGPDPRISWLFFGVIFVSVLRLLHNTAHDGLIRISVETGGLMRTIARFRMIHLLAGAAGLALAGATVERMTPTGGFVLSAGASWLLISPMIFVAGVTRKENAPGFAGFARDFSHGFEVFRTNSSVRLVTLLAAVSLLVGQLVNATLPALVRDDLGYGSTAFGITDAGWAIGGTCAAALMSLGLRCLGFRDLEYMFSLLAGVMTICFALFASIPILMALHAAMGCTVWLCRIVIEGRVLQSCGVEYVGRTRVYIEVMFSLSAILMCLSPTLVELPKTADYFSLWGGFMVAATLALWMLKRSARKRPRGDAAATGQVV